MQKTYPDAPGWKGAKSTGRDAAKAIEPDLGRRQGEVLEAFKPFGAAGAIADDLVATLNLPVHLIRPRATELESKGKLFAIGKRRGSFGHAVTVYSVVRPADQQAAAE